MKLPTVENIFLNLLEQFESAHDTPATDGEIGELKAMALDQYHSMMEAYREWPGRQA